MLFGKKIPVQIQISNTRIEGLIYIPHSKNFIGFLNGAQQFFALHEAKIWPGTKDEMKIDYLIVNKKHISRINLLSGILVKKSLATLLGKKKFS